MPPLPPDLRRNLESTIIAARQAAEEAARASLTTLAVARPEPFATMDEPQRQLRRGLRAAARQLGDDTRSDELPLLTHEVAYEQWHRMLFARFLAENGLLMHPTLGVPVSLEDCAELAQEERAGDSWDLAARYAGAMLPGIFPADDPAVQVRFAPEGRQKLEAILASLPPAVFTADDGLGWVYQFWQTDKKKEVNASGRKIGGADLAPVTQLFTEDYMVRFLLENSLGAWWAARHPESPLVREWQYLRWREDGESANQRISESAPDHPISVSPCPRVPAAGTFPGWPDRAAAITCMDPCGGSGHFVVAEFEMLRRMRMEEEGLSEAEVGDAVIRDNLFMLELDSRCTQIATFALALAAWRSGGYRPLPTPNIACSGIAVTGQLEDWLRLAGGNERLRTALERLHKLFTNAPTLGSLINPADVPLAERMFTADYEEAAPLLERALARERDDPAATVLGAAAEGAAKAAKLLAGQYILVATNVPYLGRNKQDEILRTHCNTFHSTALADLAAAFIERCRGFTQPGGTYALVTPQNWLFLGAYRALRKGSLESQTWHLVARLGPRAFETLTGEVVKPVLIVLSNDHSCITQEIGEIDVSSALSVTRKAERLRLDAISTGSQVNQLRNPDGVVSVRIKSSPKLLLDFADSYEGVGTGDLARFARYWWEVNEFGEKWRPFRGTTKLTASHGGVESVILWEDGKGELVRLAQQLDSRPTRGHFAWGKNGVAINRMSDLGAELYRGEIFDCNIAAVIPKQPQHLPAIWHFCKSKEYAEAVKAVDQTLKVTNVTLLKVPFDLRFWQSVAENASTTSDSHSTDPTQWPFAGHPVGASEPLQVAVARLLGYRWPQQADDALGDYADADGIVCLPAVAGEAPAAERLRSLLAAAYVDAWSAAEQERLLASVGFTGKTLEDWLADGFFSQHCKLFHNRPFIWHVWDGRKDGFSALVNYHRLDRPALEKLTYTYLGAWINRQRSERDAGVPAADGRLVAALELKRKLELILEGEGSPDGKSGHDIYVRWKPLHQQPIGWEPDLNDGVRLNIRPFVTAGVLRSRFTINWNKDRGANPDGSERINDRHVTRAKKLSTKNRAGPAS